MQKTALVIMAAGIGSRFGKGIKQLAPVGTCGEIIMDYSIHDAIEAGFNKVIFICMGNTCRSPMAATIMTKLMPDIRVESRGMVVLFPEPYNPKAVAVAARHDMIMPSNVSVQVVNDDFGIDTLVLTMNSSMKQKIYDTFDKAINVFTLSELAGEGDVEVPDPYGKGVEEYNKCFEQLYSYVEKVVKVISAPKNEAD